VVNASSVSRLIPPEECTTPKRPGSAPLRRRTALKDNDSNSRHNIHEKRIPRPSTAGLDPLTMFFANDALTLRIALAYRQDAQGCSHTNSQKTCEAFDGGQQEDGKDGEAPGDTSTNPIALGFL